LELLRAEVAKAGSQQAWAKQHNVDRPRVSAVLAGSRKLTPQIAAALGLTRVVAYERAEAAN